MHGNILTPRPLISEKVAFGCALRVGDHDRDNPTGKVQRQGLGEDKEYVVHKMANTGTYPSRPTYSLPQPPIFLRL